MGNQCAAPIPNLPYRDFMAINFSFDTMYVNFADAQEVDAIRAAIQRQWNRGIQKEEAHGENVYTFKLGGQPFVKCAGGSATSLMETWRMCSDVVQALKNIGWKLMVSSYLTPTYRSSTWVFQRMPVYCATSPMSIDTHKFLTIGFKRLDQILILDCPDEIYEMLKNLIVRLWLKGIQKINDKDEFVHQLQLKGNPWFATEKEESATVCLMIKEMVAELQKRHVVLYSNSNICDDADTLFFRYDPNHVPSNEPFFTLSMNMNDRLRMVSMEKHLIELIENTVRQNWSRGVQEVSESSICYELKLKGTPWSAVDSQGVEARMLMVKILERLAQVGHYLTTVLDITKRSGEKSMLIFQKGMPMTTTFVCLALLRHDKINLINAPPDLVEIARKVIKGVYGSIGVEEKTPKEQCSSYRVKLKEIPWMEVPRTASIQGRGLMLHLLSEFTKNGWRLICSADFTSTIFDDDEAFDPHGWYFMKDPSLLLQ